jgi:hypothetical protein
VRPSLVSSPSDAFITPGGGGLTRVPPAPTSPPAGGVPPVPMSPPAGGAPPAPTSPPVGCAPPVFAAIPPAPPLPPLPPVPPPLPAVPPEDSPPAAVSPPTPVVPPVSTAPPVAVEPPPPLDASFVSASSEHPIAKTRSVKDAAERTLGMTVSVESEVMRLQADVRMFGCGLAAVAGDDDSSVGGLESLPMPGARGVQHGLDDREQELGRGTWRSSRMS